VAEKRTLHLTCRRCGKPFTRQAQVTIYHDRKTDSYGWMGNLLDIHASSHDHAAMTIRHIKKAATCESCNQKTYASSNLQPAQAPYGAIQPPRRKVRQ
jgi:ribosomal protein L37E